MRRLRASLRDHPEVLRRGARGVPQCGKGPVRRLLSSPAIQFKGTGWYITDYAQKGKSGSGSARRAAAKRRRREGRCRRDTRRERHEDRATRKSDASAAAPAESKTTANRPNAGRATRRAQRSRQIALARRRLSDRAIRDMAERLRQVGPLAARNTPAPSGTRACCRCRDGPRDFAGIDRPLVCSSRRRPLVS